LGGPDLCVNAAGLLSAIGPVREVEREPWWSDVTVNLEGVFLLCRAVIPGMLEHRGGRIVNLVGGGTGGPFPFASGYAAGKAAVQRFSETLAAELEELGGVVKVFTLNPGLMRTAMTRQFEQAEAGLRWMGRLRRRLERGEHVPAARAAALVVELGSGRLDALHGRYLSAERDLDRLGESHQLVQELRDADRRTLRLR
jgi:NAD(P)-dependent dehydrogenase (short-subunit alcohol dehydrogenase family)